MKAVLGFFATIFTAAIAGMIVVAFQAPISRYFSGDRPELVINSSLWKPLPGQKVEGVLGAYATKRLAEGDPIYFAQLVAKNTGSRRIQNIRLQFKYAPKLVALVQNGKQKSWVSSNFLTLDPLDPGAEAQITIWSIFSLTNPADWSQSDFSMVSSEGPAKLTFNTNQSSEIDEISKFIDAWIKPISFILALVIFFAVTLTAVYCFYYIDSIFKDANHYRLERLRYKFDGKFFTPKLPSEYTSNIRDRIRRQIDDHRRQK